MMNDDILDTQIRVIGGESPAGGNTPGGKNRKVLYALIAVLVLVVLLLLILFLAHKPESEVLQEEEPGVFETEVVEQPQPHPLESWIGREAAADARGVALKDTVVNDIPMQVLLPVGAKAHLAVGYGCLKDTASYVLLCQAADVRADNKKIVGAFVLHGQPLSWSLGKKGYCGIIADSVKIGVAENSPLFEEAISKEGDFFRQYPLVSEGRLVENELKTKSVRRALCEVEGAVAVIQTASEESLHDFAQALVDLGVENAIYLVGSSAICMHRTLDGVAHVGGQWSQQIYKNVSFIIWQ